MPKAKKPVAEIAAEQEQAAYAEARRQLRPSAGSAVLPFGHEHNLSEWDDVKDEFTDPREFIYFPERLIAKPRPGFHYGWPDKEASSTQARINAGMYRPVKKDELKRGSAYEITSYKGVDDYVYWERHILVEMPHEVWIMLYRAPEKKAAMRVSRQQESWAGKVETASKEETGERGKAVGESAADIAR